VTCECPSGSFSLRIGDAYRRPGNHPRWETLYTSRNDSSLRTFRRFVWGRYVQRPNTVRNAPGSAPIFISIGLSYVTFVDVMWAVGIAAGETPADQ
jgi:hypothetical protein